MTPAFQTAARPVQSSLHGITMLWPGCEDSTPDGPLFSRVTDGHDPVGSALLDSITTTSIGAPWLPAWWEDEGVELGRCAFLDTETTGLQGGSGTYVFLIGIGYVEGGRFVVRQFFLRDLHEEKAMLVALNQLWSRFDTVITFNGRSFDVPLLSTRHIMQRMRSRIPVDRHLDLLWPARRLWSKRLPSSALSAIERDIFGAVRVGDIPGALIPTLYYQYLRHHDARSLTAVFEHNRRDITALAALALHLSQLADLAHDESRRHGVHPADLLALGRMATERGDTAHAVALYEQGLTGQLPPATMWAAYMDLAALYRRQGRFDDAAHVLRQVTASGTAASHLAAAQLAKYLEHRQRDAVAAHAVVVAALTALQLDNRRPQTGAIRADLEYRLRRLEKKVAAQATTGERER